MNIVPGPIPKGWFIDKNGKLMTPLSKRLILHWTVTSYEPDETSLYSYHFLIKGDGTMARGKYDPDEKAPHTYLFNSALSISLCCMGGWDGKKTAYPPTKAQWDTLIKACAQLCSTYGIPTEPNNLLMHGEVASVLGVDQWGKWDIGYLPHLGIGPETGARCGNELRKSVKERLSTTITNTSGDPKAPDQPIDLPLISYRLEGSPVVLQGFLLDGSGMVPLRTFVQWCIDAGYPVRLGSVYPTTKTFYLEHTVANFSERKDVLEGGYVVIDYRGWVELKPISQWMGLKVEVETWTKEKKVLVLRKDG